MLRKSFVIIFLIVLFFIVHMPLANAAPVIPIGAGLNANGLLYGQPVNVDTSQLFPKLKSLGFAWIRVQVNLNPIMHGDMTSMPDIKNRLPQILAAAKKAGLVVVVSPVFEDAKNVSIIRDNFSAYEGILKTFASYIVANGSSDALELLNEPEECNNEWSQEQHQLYSDMRSGYRSLPLVMTSDCWSGYRTFIKLDATSYANDPLAFFTFHFYEPNLFVSQDSPWAKDYTHCTQAVRFPPDPSQRNQIMQGCQTMLSSDSKLNSDQKTKILSVLPGVLKDYYSTNWSDRINSEFQTITQWEAANRINSGHVLLTEFGVMHSEDPHIRADEQSRIAWIKVIASAAAAHNIPWNYWGLYGDRSIANRTNPLVIDEAVAGAIVNK